MTNAAATPIDSKRPTTRQELIAANVKLVIEQLRHTGCMRVRNFTDWKECSQSI
jgi:hypothetical protein